MDLLEERNKMMIIIMLAHRWHFFHPSINQLVDDDSCECLDLETWWITLITLESRVPSSVGEELQRISELNVEQATNCRTTVCSSSSLTIELLCCRSSRCKPIGRRLRQRPTTSWLHPPTDCRISADGRSALWYLAPASRFTRWVWLNNKLSQVSLNLTQCRTFKGAHLN